MHNKKYKSGIVAGIMLPMGLVCLFAFCSLALALMGGRAYKEIQANVEESFKSTVAANYLRTKITQNNAVGAVSVRNEGEFEVLVLTTEEAGLKYETRIFVVDDKLVENFVTADRPFDPTAGLTIANVRACHFTITEDGLFTAELTSSSGEVTRTVFALAQGGSV